MDSTAITRSPSRIRAAAADARAAAHPRRRHQGLLRRAPRRRAARHARARRHHPATSPASWSSPRAPARRWPSSRPRSPGKASACRSSRRASAAASTVGGMVARRPQRAGARERRRGARLRARRARSLNGRGEVLGFGGQVMKNVAGYDVSRACWRRLAGHAGRDRRGVPQGAARRRRPRPRSTSPATRPMRCACSTNGAAGRCRSTPASGRLRDGVGVLSLPARRWRRSRRPARSWRRAPGCRARGGRLAVAAPQHALVQPARGRRAVAPLRCRRPRGCSTSAARRWSSGTAASAGAAAPEQKGPLASEIARARWVAMPTLFRLPDGASRASMLLSKATQRG